MPATTRPDPMLIDVTGRTALVTGAARGIERGIVEGLAASGARVVAADVLPEPLERMAADIGAWLSPTRSTSPAVRRWMRWSAGSGPSTCSCTRLAA